MSTKKTLWAGAACALLLTLVGCSPEPRTTPASGDAPSDTGPQPADAPEPVERNTAPAPKDERLGTAFEALGRGDLETCRAAASAVLADFPRHPRAEFLLAMGLHKSKRYAEARPLFESAERATAEYAGKEAVPYYLGWCDFWLGDFDASRAAFERHLQVVAEGDSHFGLGAIALELGDFEEAREQLTRALEIFESRIAAGELAANRDLAKTHARLADVDLAADDEASARAHLESALRLDPNRPAVWFKLYTVAEATGDKEVAAAAKAEYERRSPTPDTKQPMAGGGSE